MHAEENKTLEYSHSVAERFREEGRIFLVDYSKACAAAALLSVLKNEPPASFLMVAENVASAEDYCDRLSAVLGKITLITSAEEALRFIGDKTDDFSRVSAAAKALSKKHKNVIVSVTDKKGTPLLHKRLCKNAVVGGSFDGKYSSAYCISDFLSEGGYELVVVDGVYSAFSLEHAAEEKMPGEFDRLTLFGEDYYSKTENSYKRLERLVLSAKKKILISDVAFRDNAIHLYAALNLINNTFSHIKMREELTSNAFREHCETVNTAFSYFCNDDSCISECMQKLRGSRGYVPEDIRSMNQYFTDALSYISDEEKLLRCALSARKVHFSGGNPNLDTIVDFLMRDPNHITDCALDMFFCDAIKERIEGSISQALACKMIAADYKALFDILLEYGGVYHYLTGKDAETKVIRFLRDDSGFEHFVRRRSKHLKTDALSYSVMGDVSSDACKCAKIANLVAGCDRAATVSCPALVVASEEAAVAERLSKNLGDNFFVACGLEIPQDAGEKPCFMVCSSGALNATAKDLKFSSVIFYDVLLDVVLLRRLVNKCFCYGAENVLILADYSNMSAHLMDFWQDVLFDGSQYFPFENATVSMKENVFEEYRVAVRRIQEEYVLLSKIVRGGQYEDVLTFAKRFGSLLLDYTLKSPDDMIATDVEYLAKVGHHFEAIFANTCTIGDAGDKVTRKSLYYERTGEGRDVNTEVLSEQSESTTIFFNACTKRLFGSCNCMETHCADCEDAKSFVKNDVDALIYNADAFFKKTFVYDAKIEADRIDGVISSTISFDYGDEEEEDELVASQIREWKQDAELALQQIKAHHEKAEGGIFVCDYSLAERVRNAVYKTYRKMIRKYYITLRDLFDSSTEKALEACRASLERAALVPDDK